jgi:Na+/H+ antiporter NhaD/arsenite permease-like protein
MCGATGMLIGLKQVRFNTQLLALEGLRRLALVGSLLTVVFASVAPAAAANAAVQLPGGQMSVWWTLPFAGLLLCIAVLPLWVPSVWHRHFGKITAGWALAFLVPCAVRFGPSLAGHEFLHTMLLEFIPFLILILALYTVAGGVLIKGNLHGSPLLNTSLLAIGTAIASITGTTGASMLLIRPVIRANDARLHNAHVIVFFIFLVSNIGGALTPLGDPPLFLGFLKGVDFFWPTVALLKPMLLCVGILLVAFFILDSYLFSVDKDYPPKPDPTPDSRVRIEGWFNVGLLVAILLCVLMSGLWKPGIVWSIGGIEVALQNVVRDLLLLAITGVSWIRTSQAIRTDNGFTWGAIAEVAKLFAGIFITLLPVIAILKAGKTGALGPMVALVTDAGGKPIDAWYFWLTGGLSSFLDNAPTYLVFFNIAGGDANQLMGPMGSTLTAISAGAVFMGANSYIGNAPNMLVKSIAEERGIRMPSFFGYMLWSCAFLMPCFVLCTFVFFR